MAAPKRATASDRVIHSTIMPPVYGSRDRLPLAAVEAWHSAMAECQRELVGFLLARLEKNTIVVDDGIATGGTVRAALKGLSRARPASSWPFQLLPQTRSTA